MSKPYSFEPVIPVEEAVDLGSRLLKGQATLVELKDASGICGCIVEKYDGEEIPETAYPVGMSLQTLGGELKALGEGQAAGVGEALDIAIWLPLIMQIITAILERLGNRGGNGGGTIPGPV